MIRLMLNARKPYNYAFFDPKSRVHLTVTNPMGYADGVTPAIIRGLASSVIIDVDNVVDIKKGCLKSNSEDKTAIPVTEDINDMLEDGNSIDNTEPETTDAPEPVAAEETENEEPGDQQAEEPADAPAEEEVKEEKPKKKSSKKKA
jgi:hypothetical protein